MAPQQAKNTSNMDFFEEALTNFLESDRSLWTKLDDLHIDCGGTVWVCTADVETGQAETDRLGICEECLCSANLDTLLGHY